MHYKDIKFGGPRLDCVVYAEAGGELSPRCFDFGYSSNRRSNGLQKSSAKWTQSIQPSQTFAVSGLLPSAKINSTFMSCIFTSVIFSQPLETSKLSAVRHTSDVTAAARSDAAWQWFRGTPALSSLSRLTKHSKIYLLVDYCQHQFTVHSTSKDTRAHLLYTTINYPSILVVFKRFPKNLAHCCSDVS